MSPKKYRKSTNSLKQAKLQDMFASKRVKAPANTQASSSKKPLQKPNSHASSEEPSAIQMTPKRKPVVHISSDSDLEDASLKPHKTKRRRVVVELDSEENSLSDAPAVPSSPVRQFKVDENQSDEDDSVIRRPRRIRKRLSSEERGSESEDLAHEVDSECILDSRLRGRGKLTKFQQNLEKLKKQKAKGHNRSADNDEDSEASDAPILGSKPTEAYNEDEDEDSDDGDNDNDASDASESSEGFIVEDDNTFELPLQFSRESHADLSHQFKKVFQLFVHVAVQKPAHRAKFMKKQIEGEEYFKIALSNIRRKLSSLKDSLVSSSVWKPEFKRSLEIHPHMDLARLDFAVPFCDACHLGGRMSTLIGRVTGQPYNPYGFEALKVTARDADADSADKTQEFHLGRFCARRTKVYHQFMHWERALFHVITDELDDLRGDCTERAFHRVAFIGGKEPPKDLSDADELCEWLDQRKLIDMEWHKIEELMESARRLEAGDGQDVED